MSPSVTVCVRPIDPVGGHLLWRTRQGTDFMRASSASHCFASKRSIVAHTAASRAVLRGVPLPVVAQLPGRHSVSMTMRYVHVADRDTEAVAERVVLALAGAIDIRLTCAVGPPKLGIEED